MRSTLRPNLGVLLATHFVWLALSAVPRAHASEITRYVVSINDTTTQSADIEATIAAHGALTIELMMPIWSPGFYRVEDYAQKVSDLRARTERGDDLKILQTKPNEWTVESGKAKTVVLSYRLLCDRRSVTTNEIAPTYAVLNPAAAFVVPKKVVREGRSAIEVRFKIPGEWTVMAALPSSGTPSAPAFRARDYETLVDTPILAGRLKTNTFNAEGSEHVLVDAGELGTWDGAKAARDLQRIARETGRFWGFLPFKRYLFLNVFRQGGGGLEHKDSTLLTSSASRMATPRAYLGWLGFVGHEYFHAFNVKRVRPVELGPFDFEKAPISSSLWISEGLTTYFADLMVRRAGLSTREEYLEGLSAQIASLQKQPGRLLQSVEQSSREVWNNSNSGVGNADTTVSYYVKGDVIGFVLDARIRKATEGRRSIDDLLRLAYKRYSGKRGFTPREFEEAASRIAGADLTPWFEKTTRSTEELDYAEALDWFGLRFADPSDSALRWSLRVRDDATAEQTRHLDEWLRGATGSM